MGNLKNLLVYISPTHSFISEEAKILARIQVDNSLSLGYKKTDILCITNFAWEYNGIKAIVVGDECYCAVRPRSIKTTIIPYLVDEGIVENGKLYWNHDFDAYQMNPFDENELGLENFDAGLTDYGWRDRWCMGSFFFKSSSKDIFELAKPIIYRNIEDETAMMELTKNQEINRRCKRLNITYNFGMRNVESNFAKAIKPIRVLHFHPNERRVPALDIFMHGKNGLSKPLMNERLIKIFNQHGFM
jgi:hypothetical protein